MFHCTDYRHFTVFVILDRVTQAVATYQLLLVLSFKNNVSL